MKAAIFYKQRQNYVAVNDRNNSCGLRAFTNTVHKQQVLDYFISWRAFWINIHFIIMYDL